MRQSKKLIGFVMCLSLLLSGCGGKIGSQVELAPAELIKLTRGAYAELVSENE